MDECAIIPEEEGLVYHIISMKWFDKWKKHVDYYANNNLDCPGHDQANEKESKKSKKKNKK